MSIFDAQQFLTATTTEAGQKRDPLPLDRDYVAEIGELKPRMVKGKQDATKEYLFVDMSLIVHLKDEYPEVAHKIGVEQLNVRHSVSVDLTEQGGMDWSKGKNTGLRILREATGTNVPGQAWQPLMLQGRRVLVKFKHREYPEGSGNLVEDVAAIAKAV